MKNLISGIAWTVGACVQIAIGADAIYIAASVICASIFYAAANLEGGK